MAGTLSSMHWKFVLEPVVIRNEVPESSILTAVLRSSAVKVWFFWVKMRLEPVMLVGRGAVVFA